MDRQPVRGRDLRRTGPICTRPRSSRPLSSRTHALNDSRFERVGQPSRVRRWSLWLMLVIVTFGSGATCTRRKPLDEFAPPVVFDQTPSLEQITDRINRSRAIERIESNNLIVTSPDIVTKLNGTLKWERPDNFSLEAYAGMKVMGVAMGAGSNQEMFWLQLPSPPTIYYARHQEFEQRGGPRKILPVSPLWLREAMGIVELNPQDRHQGPTMRADGKLEIVSWIPKPRGEYQRVLIVDPNTATAEQTILYDPQGKLVAVAQQSEHEYYAEIDYSLPHVVDVQLYPDAGEQLVFSIDFGSFMFNQPLPPDSQAFQPPDPTGISTVNLMEVNAANQSVSITPPVYREAQPTRTASNRFQNLR